MDYASYAIWWVPYPGTGLGRFGAEWTGWCADRGIVWEGADPELPRPGLPDAFGASGALARHGLHAGIRSAFRLAPGRSSWALEDALADLAERTEAIRLPALELTVFDGRVALALSRPDGAVARLLTAVDEALRPFRLPLPYAARADGAVAPGRPDREAGAPVSLERFHLPLTDRLDLGTAYRIVAELGPRLDPLLARRQVLADLALVGDPGEGRRWRLLQRHALAGEPARDAAVPTGMAWRGPSLLAPLDGPAARRRARA